MVRYRARIGPLVVAVCAVLAAGLSGCGASGSAGAAGGSSAASTGASTDPATGDSSSGSSSDPATESAGAPSSEPSGPESPAAGGSPEPSLELASLPVGRANDGVNSAACVGVLVAQQLDFPQGTRIRVTGAEIDQSAEYYRRGGSGCGSDRVLCSSGTLVLTADDYRSDDSRCWVPVEPTGTTGTGDDSEHADLRVEATLLCGSAGRQACTAFAAAIGSEALTISLGVPDPAPTSSGSDGSTTGDPTSSDPASSDPTTSS